ncbi:hypothetical protein PA7_11320 [Pseudonocardia asaccharolytica DSM 44247 = NBRC 16224]|uniref:Uncharacterized protein n=1 Tax=Pseudonocardia asaccharolytica DSM 44247 = NBRC 16224 TaxID=1123024 RepID=A0A511CXM1_9PSEU|nr:hypothetical protein PA7_11320 [Pseudonocardia asaccharolytica DSM 44247 = NBRC 16224]
MTTDVAAGLLEAPFSGSRSAAGEARGSSGRLIVAWQNPETRLIAPVGLLELSADGSYRFRYLRRRRRHLASSRS